MNDVAPKDRNIAMVFQSYALYPHMTVYDNMAFGLKLRKFSRDEIDRRVQNAAEKLGLKPYLADSLYLRQNGYKIRSHNILNNHLKPPF